MQLPYPFDFKKPDYNMVFQHRMDKLLTIRKNPKKLLPAFFTEYREKPAKFIIDWGMTYDPRNITKKVSPYCPFVLFPRQIEWVEWVEERLKNNEPGLADKSRDLGVSWLSVAYACAKAIFNDGFTVGFGSRKQEYVDQLGDLKAILPKARFFMENLPLEFRAGYSEKTSPHMRLRFPDTQSFITGESGDNIGRGDRTTLTIVDEAAWLTRPHLIEASLSNTTTCRIDISTPRGTANPFGQKIQAGVLPRFSLHWTDDPRKDQAWYDKMCLYIGDPVIIAQELDLDYSASVEGVVIPALWVQASIDAHIKLDIKIKGKRCSAFDVADEGKDKNAFGGRHGILLEHIEQWSGVGSDIYTSVKKVFDRCDLLDYSLVIYDSDGIGANVRSDASQINQKRKANRIMKVSFRPFRGSGAVLDPSKDPFEIKGVERDDEKKGRTNEDYFLNRKAQAWWELRLRFMRTFRWVTLGIPCDPDSIISIPKDIPNRQKLVTELSQPVYYENDAGKMIVDKSPEGVPSPNLADMCMMLYTKVPEPTGFFSAKINQEVA